jgi:hypothetical protein
MQTEAVERGGQIAGKVPQAPLNAVQPADVEARGAGRRIGGMDENPYKSPQHHQERATPERLPKSIWFWVAFWIVIPIAVVNLIHVASVLIADHVRHP